MIISFQILSFKQLNEYSKHLNEQITENRKENLLRENMIS